MKTRMNMAAVVAGIVSLWSFATVSLNAADLTRLDSTSGSKMRIEGTSTFHDWQVESPLILGFLEVGSTFPTEPGQATTPGKVDARGTAYITVRSLQSVEKNGTKYSDKMDEKMWDMMKQPQFPRVVYRISELVLKEAPKDKNSPYVFDSVGDLAIAGVTNKLSMTVNVLPMGDKKVKITGSTPLKMSQFKIDPASIVFAKTGDDLIIKFEWVLRQKPAAAAAPAAAK